MINIDITGLTLTEISRKLAPYVRDYFAGCEISGLDNNLFAESYLLGYEEIEHLIPAEHKGYFKETDNFNGASGLLHFSYLAENHTGREYTIMLLSGEGYSRALYLYVQEDNLSTGIHTDILIADFTKGLTI